VEPTLVAAARAYTPLQAPRGSYRLAHDPESHRTVRGRADHGTAAEPEQEARGHAYRVVRTCPWRCAVFTSTIRALRGLEPIALEHTLAVSRRSSRHSAALVLTLESIRYWYAVVIVWGSLRRAISARPWRRTLLTIILVVGCSPRTVKAANNGIAVARPHISHVRMSSAELVYRKESVEIEIDMEVLVTGVRRMVVPRWKCRRW